MFTDFLTDNYGDEVRVYNSTSHVVTYTGFSIPDPIQLEDNAVTIEFTTDEYYRNTGWRLEWQSYKIPTGSSYIYK